MVKRGGKTIPLDLMERKYIEKRLNALEAVSCGQISKELGRGKNTIIVEVRRNGGREKYSATAAQKNAYAMSKARYEKLSNRNKDAISPHTRLEIRISNLEMQIEILIDQVKELKSVK